jgi:hypothetical protein
VKARPVVLVARIGRSTGCVAGSVVFVEDTDVATVARDDGVVDVVRTGSVSGDDDAIIVADVITPDNVSRSFMPATPRDCDVR